MSKRVEMAPTYPELRPELSKAELASLPEAARQEAIGRERGLDYALKSAEEVLATKKKNQR